MDLIPTTIDLSTMPVEVHSYIIDGTLYDSSCSQGAKTIYIDKDDGYFLKIAPKGTLKNDAILTDYFHAKGLSAKVKEYISQDSDYLITEKIKGQDGITKTYLDNPKKLCDVFAESLYNLHSVDFIDCPVKNRTATLLNEVERIRRDSKCDTWLLKYINIPDENEAYRILQEKKHILQNDVLIHGDYCLPNILLHDFRFSGFIDVGYGGVGDKHYDIFWGIWTLQYNLNTNEYKDRFIDCYGRENVDMERLKLCGIISALTSE